MRHLSPHTTRFIDEDTDHDKLYEVTLNTVQDRFFFIPSKLLNLLIIGVLAYSQAKTGLRVCYATFLSTHALCPAGHNQKDLAESCEQPR